MAGTDCRGNGLIRLLFVAVPTTLWWWAALRLVVQPDRAGVFESVLVAGGWSLSLLPVHCAPKPDRAGPGMRWLLRRRQGPDRT